VKYKYSIIGIDPSTTKCGVYIFDDDGTRPLAWKERALAIIPKGENHPFFSDAIYFNGHDMHYWRIMEIIKQISEIFQSTEDALVVIEGYSAGSYGHTDALAELGGAIRLECLKWRYPFISPSPNQLKKFLLGKGNAEKSEVPAAVAKRYGKWFEEFPAAARGDIADAYVLAQIGKHFVLSSVAMTCRESMAEWKADPNLDTVIDDYKARLNFIEQWTIPQREVLERICEKINEIYSKVKEIRIKQIKRERKKK
jgi:Holliday junction resolvasome RuvABC endonuclease subunit